MARDSEKNMKDTLQEQTLELEVQQQMMATNGIRLQVPQAGPQDGSLVILLHGFPEFWYGWRAQIGPLAEAGYRVWIPDQRGYNESDKPKGIRPYRLEETANDIIGLILVSGRDKVSLVGHDWGGIVAWEVTRRYSHKIERLAVLNAPSPAAFLKILLRDPSQIIRSLYALFFQIPFLPEAILRNNNWEPMVRSMQGSSQPGTFSEADFVQYRQAWWRRGAFTAMLNWYRANLRFPPDISGDQRIHVPTLVLWGAQDSALSKALAPLSLELCDLGRLVMFEEATHWVQHEEADRVNQSLLEFLHP